MKKTLYSLLFIAFIISSCKKNTDPVPAIDRDHFIAKIDGKQVTLIDGHKNYESSNGYSWGTNYSAYDKHLSALLRVDPDDWTNAVAVEMGPFDYSPYPVDSDLFFSSFSEGDKTLITNAPQKFGIIIRWYDENETEWNSFIGNQSNSKFTIKSLSKYQRSFDDDRATIVAEFNCTLYNASGDTKELTNGMLQLTFLNF